MALSAPVTSLKLLTLYSDLWWGRPRSTSLERRTIRKKRVRVSGGLGNFVHVVTKEGGFLKKEIRRGIEWASETFRLSQLNETLNDVLWLRLSEDSNSPAFDSSSWPQPYYPELSRVDLLMADLKTLDAYAVYFFYHLTKIWSKPLPEFYDPDEVADYFNYRPHLVALRLIEVVSSFAIAAVRVQILIKWRMYKSNDGVDINGSTSQYDFGLILKETMLSLGPTFIKVGQSLSTRPDIIGSEVSKALSELHEQIPPFPKPVAMQIIEKELGSPWGTFFSSMSENPVAAASFGQVYQGNTVNGDNVAIKVQRPNMRHLVVRDIYILRLGLGLLQKIAKRKSDLRIYADELGKGFIGELDYTLEASNADEFREAHSHYPFIRVPKIFHHLSFKRVLTMEWIVGENPSDLLVASTSGFVDHDYSEGQRIDAKLRLLDLVSKGIEASLVQLIETGLLHADPHAGNLRYTDTGEIGFIDFGLICRMEKKHQYAMLASIVHIVNGDWGSLVSALSQMDVVRPGTNIRCVTMDLSDALGEVEFKDGIPDVKFSRVLGKIWSVALKYHFRMPAYYTLLLRSLASLEGLAVAADKSFKTFEAAYPYVVRKLLTDNSPASTRILHSALLNRKKEFRWKRLELFLRVGTMRKSFHGMKGFDRSYASSNEGNRVFDVTSLILNLLLSKDGVVLRRLLMTADGGSLIQTLICKDGIFIRQQICGIIADIIHQWIVGVMNICFKRLHVNGLITMEAGFQCNVDQYRTIVKDRRLRLIFMKKLKSLRKHPTVMARFWWTCFTMIVTAFVLAIRRALGSVTLPSSF